MNASHTLWRNWVTASLAMLTFAGGTPQITAYEVETHARISLEAVRDPDVDRLIRDALGLADGRRAIVRGKVVESWVEEGAKREDDWGRFVFHFHNPLAAWDQAGLNLPILPTSESSVLRAQDPSNEWSLDKVRLSRTNALSKPTRAARDDAFVYLFRGLGQLIHLIQDAASPAHTRNDPHASPYNYEGLVLALHTGSPAQDVPFFDGLLNAPIKPDAGWRSLPPNPLASASNTVARLIDTDLYLSDSYFGGTNPEVTLDLRIGLAEYTNANFLSEDSTWESQWLTLPRPFRYPARPNTIVESNICLEYKGLCAPNEIRERRYYVKESPGDAGYRLATVGFLRDYFVRWNLDPSRADQRPALDETVYRDYARRLLGRAVGYSAAFLEDFLRGEFSVEILDFMTLKFVNQLSVPIEGVFWFYYEKPDGTLVEWYVNRSAFYTLAPGEELLQPYWYLAPERQAVTCRYVFRGRTSDDPPLSGTDPAFWPARSAHAVPCPVQQG